VGKRPRHGRTPDLSTSAKAGAVGRSLARRRKVRPTYGRKAEPDLKVRPTYKKGAGLTVAITDADGCPTSAGRGLGVWLRQAAPAGAKGCLGIALVDDRTMQRLNAGFRGVDQPTDVLSFPAGEPGGRPRILGDIAISLDTAARQAAEHGHSTGTELRVLALHGLLHLLGYDHETDQGDMRRLEERLRRRAGLPAGLIARPPGRRNPG
jgi:probable rRNA maturation factor